MKKVFIVLLLLSQIVSAQNLQSFLSVASFNSPEGPFLETYMSFNANTLILENNNGKYYGEIDVTIQINSNNNEIFNDHYLLKSLPFDSISNNNIFFIDQQRISLNNGKYSIEITVFDVNEKIEKAHTTNIDIDYDSGYYVKVLTKNESSLNLTIAYKISKIGAYLTTE